MSHDLATLVNVVGRKLAFSQWGWCSELEMHLIFNDVAEVIPITVILPYDVVMDDASPRIMLG
jgi:hypothetical protein